MAIFCVIWRSPFTPVLALHGTVRYSAICRRFHTGCVAVYDVTVPYGAAHPVRNPRVVIYIATLVLLNANL